jgi:hypothetical protein
MPINRMIPADEFYARTCHALMQWDRINTSMWKAWSQWQLDCARLCIGGASRVQASLGASTDPSELITAPWALARDLTEAFLETNRRHMELLAELQSQFPKCFEGSEVPPRAEPARPAEVKRRAA